MDRTSLLWGPTRSIALVLALLNGSKLKHLVPPLLIILINIQFGHFLIIAIIKIKITTPILHTNVLGF
jgi:hypothetical protein